MRVSEKNKLELAGAAATGMITAYHAQERPETKAVVSNYGERTFAELNARVNQLARVLRNAGLKPDDGVAMLLTNRPEFVEVYYACMRTGMRITPINWHLTGDNASYIVTNSGAKAFIADIRCQEPAIEALKDNATQLNLSLAVGGSIGGFQDYDDVLAGESTSNIEAPEIGSQMLYTSGTTGRPKGVYRERELPGKAPSPVAATTTRTVESAGFQAGQDLVLCTGPAYHAAPLTFNITLPLAAGVGTVLMDKWDAEETLHLIETHSITHTHMVATMFHRLLALPDDVRGKYDLSSIRYVLHGAAPCPVHTKQEMIDWLGPVIYEYYAATEGGGGFFIDSEEWLSKPGSVGKAPAEADNKIVDDDGNEVPVEEVGTIYFRSPPVKFVYFKDDDKTNNSYAGDYFTLGDMGYFDDDGYLFLTGRNAETIISGGVNIYPQETDDVLLKHAAVGDVCTVGIPSEEWGEEVRSVVMLKSPTEDNAAVVQELIAFCRDHLPHFKCPRSIDIVDELPRLPSGKIQRKVVRAPYWEGRKRQI
jgi:long-chain acyl-CoA synthetase